MGDHNIYRSRYHTTHSHDTLHGSRVWSCDGKQIAGACSQADAEIICVLLNRWTDIQNIFVNVKRALEHNEKVLLSYDNDGDQPLTTGLKHLYMQKGLLDATLSGCHAITRFVRAAINHTDDVTWSDGFVDDAWQEARTMAGMAHGNRGLADHGGLEIDDRYGHHEEE